MPFAFSGPIAKSMQRNYEKRRRDDGRLECVMREGKQSGDSATKP